MLALPLYAVLLGITVWGFFSTSLAGWIFFGLALFFATWLLLTSYSLRSKWIAGLAVDAFTAGELEVFRRYTIYFMLPFQAKQYSSTFSFIQVLCLVWGGLCWWRGEWILLGGMVVILFVAANMASFLNQGNFLRHHYGRGKLSAELVDRLGTVEAVEGIILKARGLERDA
jgi:hypothetical protein